MEVGLPVEARIRLCADANNVADFDAFHVGADANSSSDDLVPDYDGIGSLTL